MSRFHVTSKLAAHGEFYSFIRGEKIVPINVEISPSAECDANCPDCLYLQKRYSRKGFIDTVLLLEALACMERIGVKAITWSGGGEPTMHPDFKTLVESCREMDQGLFTNALSDPEYNPELLNWIRVTLPRNKHAPIDHIKRLRACKTLGLCVNIGTEDCSEVDRALSVLEETGADYVQVRPALKANGLVTSRELPKFNDPRVIVADYKFKDCFRRHGYEKCYGFHFVPFLWENGQLDVCGYMREHEGFTIGNLHENTFEQLVERFPEFVKVQPTCQVCCKNHEINKLINEVKNMEDENFV